MRFWHKTVHAECFLLVLLLQVVNDTTTVGRRHLLGSSFVVMQVIITVRNEASFTELQVLTIYLQTDLGLANYIPTSTPVWCGPFCTSNQASIDAQRTGAHR